MESLLQDALSHFAQGIFFFEYFQVFTVRYPPAKWGAILLSRVVSTVGGVCYGRSMEEQPTLATQRLLLRAWKTSDIDAFVELNADPEVMRYMPSCVDREGTEQMVGRMQTHIKQHGFGLWAVERKEIGDFIGFIGLMVPSFTAHFTPCVEIGWRLAKHTWNQGLATEGARAALSYGFENLQLNEILSLTALINLPSQRVMQKIGMTRRVEDNFEHPYFKGEHPLRAHLLYRLLKQEWQETTLPTLG
jgi:RimJ/RimL family protein N-acetyltransferase